MYPLIVLTDSGPRQPVTTTVCGPTASRIVCSSYGFESTSSDRRYAT